MSSDVTIVETGRRSSALNTEKAEDGKAKTLLHIARSGTKEAERKWLLQQMAAAFRIFVGFADGSSGHFRLRSLLNFLAP